MNVDLNQVKIRV